jgi:hypothetical protein
LCVLFKPGVHERKRERIEAGGAEEKGKKGWGGVSCKEKWGVNKWNGQYWRMWKIGRNKK